VPILSSILDKVGTSGACRELDDALSLTDSADDFLKESRTGKNILHKLIPLLRQSIYSRLAGYDDTNDADRLSKDPAMRVVVGWKGPHKFVANQVRLGLFILAYPDASGGNLFRRLALPEAIKRWSMTSIQTSLIKAGGRLVRHARRLVFQLAEVMVTRDMFDEMLERIGRLRFNPG